MTPDTKPGLPPAVIHETVNTPASTDDDLHFGHFAMAPEYREVNRGLLGRLTDWLPNPFTHVDIATGTGLVPQVLIELAKRRGIVGRIIAIDPNPISLAIAREGTPKNGGVAVEFVQGFGQETDQLVHSHHIGVVDSVSIHDAIHEIDDPDEKRRVFVAMLKILKTGGLLTYNSAFTTVAMREAALAWGRWKARAVAKLSGKRDKDIKAIRIHTPGEYVEMICGAGAEIVHEEEKVVRLSKKALEDISRYPAFIIGVFRDMVDENRFSLEQKRDALIQALADLHIDGLPRVWHEVIARKMPATA